MTELQSSNYQIQVPASTGAAEFTRGACIAILMHASGTLSHVAPDDSTITLTDMPAGLHLIRSKRILVATTAKVTCFFN